MNVSYPNGRQVFLIRVAKRSSQHEPLMGEALDVSVTGSNKQAEIVAAAVQLFQQKGYHATSMQDIADAVGLQKGSLYHYISGKEELLVEIFHNALAKYNARLSDIVATNLAVREKIEMAVRHHLEGIAENLGVLTIFLRESYALTPEQQARVDEETARYNVMFEQLLIEGMATGEIRQLDPKLATRTILGSANWFYRWYRPDGRMSLDQVVNAMLDMILGGIAAK